MVTRFTLQRLTGVAILITLMLLPVKSAFAKQVLRIGNVAQGGTYQLVLEQLIPQFEAQYPGVEVELEFSPGGLDQLLVQVATGTAPDIFALQSFYAPMFYDLDLVAPLEVEAFDATGYGEVLDRLFPGIENVLLYDDTMYFMPVELNTWALYLNRAILDELGLGEVPSTWQELLETSKYATQTRGDGTVKRSGTILRGGSYFGTQLLVHMSRQNGAWWLNDTGQANFSSSEAVEAISLYSDFFQSNVVHPETDPALLARGEALFMPGVLYELFHIQDTDTALAIDAHPFPVMEGGIASTPSYALGWFVSNTSSNKTTAWQLIQFISSPEASKLWWETANLLTPYRGTWLQDLVENDPSLLVFLNELDNAHLGLLHADYTNIVQKIAEADSAIRNGQPVTNVLLTLDDEINVILNRAKEE